MAGLYQIFYLMNLINLVMDKQKFFKTIEIIAKAAVAIAAVWLAVSCTLSMSISKNNTNSNQTIEQSQATTVDSTHVNLSY